MHLRWGKSSKIFVLFPFQAIFFNLEQPVVVLGLGLGLTFWRDALALHISVLQALIFDLRNLVLWKTLLFYSLLGEHPVF